MTVGVWRRTQTGDRPLVVRGRRERGVEEFRARRQVPALIDAIVEVKTAGCSAEKLRECGFKCAELKAADYTLSELKHAGFSTKAVMRRHAGLG